jgi:hypothetical protein
VPVPPEALTVAEPTGVPQVSLVCEGVMASAAGATIENVLELVQPLVSVTTQV